MNIFFLANNPAQEYPATASFDEVMGSVGFNTGNQLFTQAVLRHLRFERSGFGFYFDPEYVQANFDAIVVPAANWINAGEDFGEQADCLAQTNLPIYVLGLGAQSHATDAIPVLKPGTLRLLQLFSKRTETIGVRGDYTQRVLNHYGIKNVRVIGCPSTFWHRTPNACLRARRAADGPPLRIAFNGTRYHLHPQLFDTSIGPAQTEVVYNWLFAGKLNFELESKLYHSAFASDSDYIYQSERHEMRHLLGRAETEFTEQEKMQLTRLYGAPNWPALDSYIRRRGKAFFYPGEWISKMADYDFVIGSRLHGCMTALLGGTPSCLITHDTRTRELAAFLGMPSLSAAEFLARGNDLRSVYDNLDLEHFYTNYRLRFLNYRSFLEENGLPHILTDGQNADSTQGIDFLRTRLKGLSASVAREAALAANLRTRFGQLETRTAAAADALNDTEQSLAAGTAGAMHVSNILRRVESIVLTPL